MLRFVFSIIFPLFFYSITFALPHLPKTAVLKYLDTDPVVQNLQIILNSDPDTLVDTSGPGSSGKEVWFFGAKTLDAVKRFQQKYGLEVTGTVNVATINKLNSIGSPTPTPTIIIKSVATETEDTSNPYLSSSDNAYVSYDGEPGLEDNSGKQNTYIDNLANKYTNSISPLSPLFTNFTPTTQLQTTNINGFNPYMYGGMFPRDAVNGNGLGNLFSNFGGNSGLGGALQSFLNPQSQRQADNQQPYTGDPLQTTRSGGDLKGDGFGVVMTTAFGHERNGRYDNADNGQPSCSSSCSTRKGGKCEKIASLKKSLRIKIFGNIPKSGWCGKELEIVYPKRKTCGVYPLYEEGPAERLQASMDLTGTIWNELDPGGNPGNQKDWMQFRVLKNGDTACAGYTRVDGK